MPLLAIVAGFSFRQCGQCLGGTAALASQTTNHLLGHQQEVLNGLVLGARQAVNNPVSFLFDLVVSDRSIFKRGRL